MSTTEQQNQDPFLHFGGIFNYDPEDKELGLLLGLFKKMESNLKIELMHHPTIATINVVPIMNTRANALVGRYNSEYYIGVYLGALTSIEFLFTRFLSYPKILSHLGDTSKEVEVERVYDLRISDIEQVVDIFGAPVYPKDALRFNIARWLQQMVVTYLIYHELSHIVLGHVDYRMNVYGINTVHEFEGNEPAKQESDAIFSQVCERDADSLAILRCMQWLEKACKLDNAQWKTVFSDIESAVYIWTFAIYSFWKQMSGVMPRSFKISQASHPPTEVRQFLLLYQIEVFFRVKYEDYPDKEARIKQIIDSSMRGAFDAEKAFSEASHQEFTGYPEMFREEVMEYIDTLKKHQGDVEKALNPFQLINPNTAIKFN